MKKIMFTGGGTAGHITPNIAIIDRLDKEKYEVVYVGQTGGMEEGMITAHGVRFIGIPAGKLRRYFDLKNVTDVRKIYKGYRQAKAIIKAERPDVVFSKGGFVSCPVVWAAHSCKVPVVIHESDLRPGLANKLSLPYADTFCCAFADTIELVKKKKIKKACTGIPIRHSLLTGNKIRGKQIANFTPNKPIILVMGGSSGARNINIHVREALPRLLEKYQVAHLCGKGNLAPELDGMNGYFQLEFATEELPHLYAMSDLVISRAGATALFELLSLNKPALLIPLPMGASRGDQLDNADFFAKLRLANLLLEEDLTVENLLHEVDTLYRDIIKIKHAIKDYGITDGVTEVIREIEALLK